MKKYKKLDYQTQDLESLSNSDLKKIADSELRRYLLAKNPNEWLYCPIKKKKFHSFNMQVAHFYDRGIMELRYDLQNCHLISKSSNEYDAQIQVEGYKSKHHKEYEEWLYEEYGQQVLNDLRERSKEIKIFYQQDYIDIINKFRNG